MCSKCSICGAEAEGVQCSKCRKISDLKAIISELNDLMNVPEMLETEAGVEGVNCRYYDIKEFTSSMNATIQKKEHLSFFHLNVASLNAHYDELKTLLCNLGGDFSIVGITETRLCDTHLPDSLSFSNYNSFHTPREGQCGGSLLYVSKNMEAIYRPDLEKNAV